MKKNTFIRELITKTVSYTAIAAALCMLIACTANNSLTASAASSAPVTVVGESEADATGHSSEPVSELSSELVSELSSELVSDRDQDPTYDTESAAAITLQGDMASCDSSSVTISGSTITIHAAGTYIVSGTLDKGQIIVDAGNEDKIQLVLDGCNISSADSAAIYVVSADKVFITLEEGSSNTLRNGGTFTANGDDNIDGVIFSKDDLTINGEGSLTISSPAGNGIVCKDELVITGGTYQIDSSKNAIEANDSIVVTNGSISITGCNDGLHAENDDDDTLGFIVIQSGELMINAVDDGIHATSLVTIDDGNIEITAAEAVEGTCITINGGVLNLTASDDGINAAHKSDSYTPAVKINGGEITIVMGQGDTDGIDSNGNLIISGGTIDITAQSPFDYDGNCEYSGGTIIVNGTETNSISNQFMGPGMGAPGMQGNGNSFSGAQQMNGGKRR